MPNENLPNIPPILPVGTQVVVLTEVRGQQLSRKQKTATAKVFWRQPSEFFY